MLRLNIPILNIRKYFSLEPYKHHIQDTFEVK